MAKKLVFFICLLVLSGCSSQELSGTIGSPSPFKTDGDNVVLRDSTKIVGSTTTNATFGTASSTNLCLIGDSCITTWPTSILTDLDLTSGFVITGDAGNKASATPAIFIDGYQIGIGTTTPDYTLDVYGNTRIETDLLVSGNASSTAFYADNINTLNVTSTNAYFTNLTVLGSLIGTLTGNADTATALAANPTDCGAGEFANAIAASGNLTCAVPAGGSSLWTQSNNNIYYNLGRVGIGTSSPEAILSISSSTQSAIPLVQVASTTGAMLFTIKSNGTIGIATSTPNPAYVLDIYGKTRTTNLELGNTTNAFQNGIIYKDGTPFIHNFNYGWNGTVTTLGENTFIGELSGNLTMGQTAGASYLASYNTGIGYRALNQLTTGFWNVGIGARALNQLTSGQSNVGIGMATFNQLTTGTGNVGIGYSTLNSSISGSNNVAIGNRVLLVSTGSNNMGLGANSMRALTSGTGNTAVGVNSGWYTAVGTTPNQTSNYSVYMGGATRALADNDTNEIVIGYDAIGAGSNSVTLGSTTIQTTYLRGNVAIGTSTAVGLLDIYALGTSTLMIDSSTKGGCLCLADDDGVGYTCVGGNDGTVYWYSSGIGCH